MDDRALVTLAMLVKAELEFHQLRVRLLGENRLTPRVKHDLANALSLVVGFRELISEEEADADLVTEAIVGLGRAWQLVDGCGGDGSKRKPAHGALARRIAQA